MCKSIKGIMALCFICTFLMNASGLLADNVLSEDWAAMNQTSVHGNSMAYDGVSHKMIIPQIEQEGPLLTFDAEDGSLTTFTLSKKDIVFDSLGCFAIAASESGYVYGFAPGYIVEWPNLYDDSPTSYPVTLANTLARNMEVLEKDDQATIYLIGGKDYGPIDVIRGGKGKPFESMEILGSASGDINQPGGKSGVTADAAYPANVIYGSECVSGLLGVHIWKRVSNVMTYSGELPMPLDVGTPAVADVAYEPDNDGLIFILTCQGGSYTQPNRVLAINAKTNQEEGRYDLSVNDAAFQRGSLALDRKNKKLYWYGRPMASTNSEPLGNWGRLSYTIPPVRPTLTPTPIPTPTATTTPTPTITPLPPNPDTEIRALWVTRWDYKTTETLQTIIKNAAECHFNIILLQVRGNATVFYPSELEPWAWELTGTTVDTTGKDPGWDPLAVAISEAHQRGLQLHAYINTYPGWKETVPPPASADQLWNTHRDWFACAKDGTTMWPSDWWTYWYTFLSPGHPEARNHIHSIYMEVLERYPQIDGLHYDYIRYPSEVGDFSWNPTDVSLFSLQYSGTPDEKPAEWSQWKRDQITELVQNNYTVGEGIRFYTMFSSAVLGTYASGRDNYFQDSHKWLSDGIIDCIMPMLYTSDIPYFSSSVQDHVAARNSRFVTPGIGVSSVNDNQLLQEIYISRNLGASGVCLFAYSTLFPGGAPGAKANALLSGPFSNIAQIPLMPWKYKNATIWVMK